MIEFLKSLFGFKSRRLPGHEFSGRNLTELAEILKGIKFYITDESDMSWSGFSNAGKLRKKLDRFIVELENGNSSVLKKIEFEFLPTGSLQEHSLSNGWADEYNKFAARFDSIYKSIKRK